jgi:hypothetical protein
MRSISLSISPVSIEATAKRPVVRRSLASIWTAVRQLHDKRVPCWLSPMSALNRASCTPQPQRSRGPSAPASRCLHDGSDRCSFGLSEHGEDSLLLRPAAGRTRGNVRRPCGLFVGLLARAELVFVGVLLCDMFGILFGCDGTMRRHHRSPAVAPSPAGQDPR